MIELNAASRTLWLDQRQVQVGDRAFDLLAHLARHRDRVVTKGELLAALWPDRIVEDANLHVHVSALRRALGAPTIVTVHGVGYRLAVPLQAQHAPLPSGNHAVQRQHTHDASPLFGREAELAEWLARWPRAGWLTITGPGGVGKTALARALLAARLEDPALPLLGWVDVSGLGTPQALAHALTRYLGLPDASDLAAPQAALRAAASCGLLVLDGAETQAAAVTGWVAALQTAAPHVQGLVTSRGALGLPGELVCELHGLPVATGDDDAELASSPAVALLLSRARAAGARPADAPLSTLATLCRRLDGLPLALELAAARLPLLGLDGLMSSLDERLHVWVDTRSGRPAHHHSLNDLLNWSWQLLDPGEQQLLRRLGALHGSFTLELAQAAADASDRAQERGTFLDRFEHLRRLSLVAPDAEAQPQPPSAPTPPRWRLLDTTRQFAQQQLAQAGETESTALRVASAVARAFERLHREWWQGQRPEADIDREASPWVPELCAALDTACAHIGQHGALAAALWADGARTLALHGLRPRARVWADAAWSQRHRLPALQPLRMLAATTSVAPTGLLDSSARARALDEAARAAQTADNRPLWLELLLAAAQAARRASQLEAAGHGCSTLQQALRATDAPRWHARALELQATLHTYHGIGTPVSPQQLQEMLDDLRSAGDGDARVAFLLRIEVGERLLLQGQAAQARDSLQATCDAVARAGRWHERVLLAPFDTLAAAALACGDLQTAASALGLALDAARRTQQWPEATSVLAAYLAAQGRLRAAAELLGATQACLAQRGLGTDTMLAHSLAAAERVLQADSLPSERRRWLAQGWAAGEEGLRLWVGQAHRRFMP